MSPQILRTTQRLPKEMLQYEPTVGFDGQGKPSYGTPVSFEANTLLYDPANSGHGAQFTVNATGSVVRIPLMLYVQGDETNVPVEGGRVTRAGRKYIVVEAKPVSGLDYTPDEPDHHEIRCRTE
jgi:hypothetical protein